MLIVEIGLTIAAWKRGWKGWALLPGAFVFMIGFFWVFITGDEEAVMDTSFVAFLPDLAAVIALIVMVAKKRNPSPEKIRVATVPADNAGFYCQRCGSSQIAGNSYCDNCGQEFGTWAS